MEFSYSSEAMQQQSKTLLTLKNYYKNMSSTFKSGAFGSKSDMSKFIKNLGKLYTTTGTNLNRIREKQIEEYINEISRFESNYKIELEKVTLSLNKVKIFKIDYGKLQAFYTTKLNEFKQAYGDKEKINSQINNLNAYLTYFQQKQTAGTLTDEEKVQMAQYQQYLVSLLSIMANYDTYVKQYESVIKAYKDAADHEKLIEAKIKEYENLIDNPQGTSSTNYAFQDMLIGMFSGGEDYESTYSQDEVDKYNDWEAKAKALRTELEQLGVNFDEAGIDYYIDFQDMVFSTAADMFDGITTTVKDFVNDGINSLNNLVDVWKDIDSIADFKNAIISTGATTAVTITSLANGALNVQEFIIDAAAMLGGSVVSLGALGVGAITGNGTEWGSDTLDMYLDFIREDQSGKVNKWFYENTGVGQVINDYSTVKYDSTFAQGLTEIDEFVIKTSAIAITSYFCPPAGMVLGGAIYGGDAIDAYTSSVDREHGEEYNYLNAYGQYVTGIAKGVTKAQMYGNVLNLVNTLSSSPEQLLTQLMSNDCGADSGKTLSLLAKFKNTKFGGNFLDYDNILENIGVILGTAGSDYGTDKDSTEILLDIIKGLGSNMFNQALGAGAGILASDVISIKLNDAISTKLADIDFNKLINEADGDSIKALAKSLDPENLLKIIDTIDGDAYTKLLENMDPDSMLKLQSLLPADAEASFNAVASQIAMLNYNAGKGILLSPQTIKISSPDDITEDMLKSIISPDKVIFEIDGKEYDYIDMQSIVQKSKNFFIKKNNIALKEKILKKYENIEDPILKARALYMELNQNVHYNNSFSENKLLKEKYLETISFENFPMNDNVVCKGWSELYRELLIDSGFPPENVKINGKEHFWVEIEFYDRIIVADATEGIAGSNDLAASKLNYLTTGFMQLNKDKTGIRLKNGQFTKEILDFNNEFNFNLDKELGFCNEVGYKTEQIIEATKLFSNNDYNLISERLPSDLISQKILNNVDALEYYVYFTKNLRNFGVSADASLIIYEGNNGVIQLFRYDDPYGYTYIYNGYDMLKYESPQDAGKYISQYNNKYKLLKIYNYNK